jgi:hypothetical protein
VESVLPLEVKLAAATIAKRFIKSESERLIGDKAYDSNGQNQQLESQLRIEIIALHRGNRKKPRGLKNSPHRRFSDFGGFF